MVRSSPTTLTELLSIKSSDRPGDVPLSGVLILSAYIKRVFGIGLIQ